MKKIFAAVLALTLLLTGCGSAASALDVPVPDGFQKTSTKGVDAYYICEDRSNINWVAAKKDKNFEGTTAESLEEGVKAAIKEQKKDETQVTVTTNSFEFTTIAGYPAYLWDSDCTLSSGTLRQLVVCIDGDSQYTVTYTDATPTQSWMDTFYESARNLTIQK